MVISFNFQNVEKPYTCLPLGHCKEHGRRNRGGGAGGGGLAPPLFRDVKKIQW